MVLDPLDQLADILTVISDRITCAFNRSGATRAVALNITKYFDTVWHGGLLHKLSLNFGSDIRLSFVFSQ